MQSHLWTEKVCNSILSLSMYNVYILLIYIIMPVTLQLYRNMCQTHRKQYIQFIKR